MSPVEARDILLREGLQPPRRLTLSITGACNLKCLHCMVDSGVVSSAGHVPTRTVRRLVEEFAAMGGEGVRFTGGEPLCHPDWLELMRLAREIEFQWVALQTNAIMFSAEQAVALRKLAFPELSIQVSLDGAIAQTHDLVRGEGAFERVLTSLRLLVDEGLGDRVTLFFTEMRHNLDQIPEVLELADELGIASVVTGTLIVGGRAAEDSLVAQPEPEQYLRLLQRYDDDPRFRELYEKIGNVAALEWRKPGGQRSECCTFVENPYLTPRGELYPCVLCHTDEYAVSGVFDKPLGEAFADGARLWSSLLDISRCRADTIPECQDCPGKLDCAGGCMGRAWGSCADLMATDDRCRVRRAIYRQK